MVKQMPKRDRGEKKTINLKPETYRKLRIYAAKVDKYMMDIMDEALSEFMKKNGPVGE